MKQGLEKQVDYHFDAAGLDAEAVARLAADMWADLPFDRDALAALKRDGLMLDGLNIGGPCPYRIAALEGDRITVTADGDQADVLLDLWRMPHTTGRRARPQIGGLYSAEFGGWGGKRGLALAMFPRPNGAALVLRREPGRVGPTCQWRP